MMMEMLDKHYGWRCSECEPQSYKPRTVPLSPREQRDLDLLEKGSKWQVALRVVVVHTDAKTAGKTGLFGILGDARVQIVDIADEAKTKAMLDFPGSCERKAPAVSPQRFSKLPVEAVEQELRDMILAEFGSKKLAASMRPAIMFRLCTRACNHVGNEQ